MALALVKEKEVEFATIATSAILLDLTISTWTGRKRDRKSTDQIIQQNHAMSSKAASVIKNLLSDDPDLDKLRAYAQDTRLYVIRNTLSWNDAGTRLLPATMVVEVTGELDARIAEYGSLTKKFLATYPTKISAAAFKLGSLFDRAEYPSVDEVARKFSMRYIPSPVPTSGDFRVDVQNDVGNFLKEQYEKAANERLAALMREPWERAFETLAHAKERMEAVLSYAPGPDDNPRSAPKLFQSMLDNALEQANLLDKLNVTNDAQLSDCAARIRRMFGNTDIKSLRESKEKQEAVKKQVDEILDKFDFSDFQMEE